MKITLTKNEKIALRSIAHSGGEKPANMNYTCFFLCVLSLERKGLVEAHVNYDRIIDAKLSYTGKAYLAENPLLRNPVDWYKVITTVALILTATVAITALFISCKLLK